MSIIWFLTIFVLVTLISSVAVCGFTAIAEECATTNKWRNRWYTIGERSGMVMIAAITVAMLGAYPTIMMLCAQQQG